MATMLIIAEIVEVLPLQRNQAASAKPREKSPPAISTHQNEYKKMRGGAISNHSHLLRSTLLCQRNSYQLV